MIFKTESILERAYQVFHRRPGHWFIHAISVKSSDKKLIRSKLTMRPSLAGRCCSDLI